MKRAANHLGHRCCSLLIACAAGCALHVTPEELLLADGALVVDGRLVRDERPADASLDAPPLEDAREREASPRDAVGPEGGGGSCDPTSFSVPSRTALALLSRTAEFGPSDGAASEPSTAGDGQLVAFTSEATNLVANDRNGARDVFLNDRRNVLLSRISLGPGDVEANGPSYQPRVASNGRWVVFTSEATNLAPPAVTRGSGVFLYGLARGRVQRIDARATPAASERGSHHPLVASNGTRVVFTSDVASLSEGGDTNNADDVYLWEDETQLTTRLSLGPGGREPRLGATALALTSDGARVAVAAPAGDLGPGAPTPRLQLYVYDLATRTHLRVPPPASGPQALERPLAASFSRDGSVLAFVAYAHAMPAPAGGPKLFVYDAARDRTELVTGELAVPERPGDAPHVSLSIDGRLLAWSANAPSATGCPRGVRGLVLRDRTTGTQRWQRLADEDTGAQHAVTLGELNADGTQAVFTASAPFLATTPDGAAAPAQAWLVPLVAPR